jgi:hypothetical protein
MHITASTQRFVRDHAEDDIRQLALKGSKDPDVDLPFALDQIRGRQEARQKLPSWAAVDDLVFPPHLAMEQCSSEAAGRYKQWVAERLILEKSPISSISTVPTLLTLPAEFIAAAPYGTETETGGGFAAPAPSSPTSTMTDLTGGFGVDFSFLSRLFGSATYVERQEVLCDVARHNFPILGLTHATVVNAEASDFLGQMSKVDLIFMDPARRDAHGARTYGIADCTPNVLSLLPQLLRLSGHLLLKLSPMLDVRATVESLNEAAGRPVVRHVHVVSVGNECKELLVVLGPESAAPLLFCANIADVFVCRLDEDRLSASPVLDRLPAPGDLLFEPNASLMKGLCFGPLSQLFDLRAVGINSHLFVAPAASGRLPGRRFVVDGVSGLGRRAVRELLGDIKTANVSVRNFPLSADQLRRRLKLRDGGDVYLFGTTAADGQHILLRCHKA